MSESADKFMKKKDFALSRGWSPSYVTKLKDQGRLVMNADGTLVDVEATVARLAESSDPGKKYVADRHAEARVQRDVGQHIKHDAPEAREESASSDQTFWKAKAKRETALAELAELELAKELGHLVEADAVHRALAEASRMLRDMILAVPSRVAGQVISSANAGEAERTIRAELRSALDQFARLSADGLARVGAASAEAA